MSGRWARSDRLLSLALATVIAAGLAATPVAVASAQGVVAPPATVGSVSGRVVDSVSRLPLASAIVTVGGSRVGAQTDSTGQFRIEGLAAGLTELRTRLVGYAEKVDTVVVRDNDVVTIEIALTTSVVQLGVVRTEARRAERELFEERPSVGVISIPGVMVTRVPRLGEADVFRAAQLLPGVQARNDFTAGLNVRGGEADQNLILMDGFPIFNPFHFGGLFGTFIDGAVAELELMTGGFSAPYGGRLSSVMNVKSSEETRSGLHGSSTVSLLASNLVVGSALPNARGSWMVAGRRTYADALLKLVGQDLLPYHFRDLQAHATYRLGESTMLTTTLYDGIDDIDVPESDDIKPFRFMWGNTVAGIRVSTSLGSEWQVEQQLSYSRFKTALDLDRGALLLENRIADWRLAGSATWTTKNHRRTAGYEVTHDPIVYDVTSQASDAAFFRRTQSPTAIGLYYDELWNISKSLMVNVGGRAEELTGSGWRALSPRASAKWFLTRNFAVTGAVGRYSQWLHSLAREDIPIRLFDFWSASDAVTPVSRATHYVLGGEAWLSPNRFIRIEGYDKRYDALVEPNPSDDPNREGDEFLASTGNSYGLDVLVRQLEHGRWSGWLAYTFGYNRRSVDSTWYYPGQDRRHNLNLVAAYQPSAKYRLSARWGYGSGTPFTDIVGQFGPHPYNVRSGRWTANDSARLEPIGAARNASRYPTTQRLDVSLTRESGGRRSYTPFVSLINAYNAQNVFMYLFDYGATPPTRKALSQIPILPTIGLTVTF